MTWPQACCTLGRYAPAACDRVPMGPCPLGPGRATYGGGHYDKIFGTWNGVSLPPTGPGPLGNEVGTWKRPDGAQPPGASMDNPASITEYDQTDDEVSFTIKLPEPAAKKDVEIMIKTKAISVTAHGVSLLERKLAGQVYADDCVWCLANFGTEIQVTLTKCKPSPWPCVLEGDASKAGIRAGQRGRTPTPAMSNGEIKAFFDSLGTDQSGKIDLEELKAEVRSLRHEARMLGDLEEYVSLLTSISTTRPPWTTTTFSTW